MAKKSPRKAARSRGRAQAPKQTPLGRKPAVPGGRRQGQLAVPFSAEEREALNLTADRLGMSASELVRMALRNMGAIPAAPPRAKDAA